MSQAPRATLDFASKEEFRAACRLMSARMHYLNRVAMGEQGFAADVAAALDALGRAFETYYDDPEIRAAFGDGWSAGTLSDDARAAYLWKLMTEGK